MRARYKHLIRVGKHVFISSIRIEISLFANCSHNMEFTSIIINYFKKIIISRLKINNNKIKSD